MIPCLIATYFAVQYVQNEASPKVTTSLLVDLGTLPPVTVSLSCAVTTSRGADPACPSSDFPAATMGFQFVDRLQGPKNGTCASLARSPRPPSSRSWANTNPRGLLDAYIGLGGLSAFLTPSQQAALPIIPTTYSSLLSSFGVRLDDLWSGAGLPLPTDTKTRPSAWAATLQARPSTTQLDPSAAVVSNVAAGVTQDARSPAGLSSSAADDAAFFGPFPVCPFPRISSTKSLTAAPATSGVGYLAPLVPGFNWSATSPGRRTLLVDVSSALGAGNGVLTVPIIPPSASATGDELHDLWSAFAQQYSRSEDSAPRFPFVEYSVDLTRTTDRSVSPPTVTIVGVATPATGWLRHVDVLNVFGFPAHVTALAECGELFSVTPAQLLDLYSISQVSRRRVFDPFTFCKS